MRFALPLAVLAALTVPAPAGAAAEEADLKQWPRGPVRYIAQPDELKTYRRLESDGERLLFVERFWARRDPTPETLTNEYRQLFWDRVQEANSRFLDSATPGWTTDRGKVHVLYGPPTRIEEDLHLATDGIPGGGRGLIRWIYEGRPGGRQDVDAVVVVAFVREATGEYRISYDPQLTSVFFDALAIKERRYAAMERFLEASGGTGRSELAVMLDLGKMQEVPPQAQVLLEYVETTESYRARALDTRLARYDHPDKKGGVLVVVTADVSDVSADVTPSILARFAFAGDPAREPRLLGEDSFEVRTEAGRRLAQGRLVLDPGEYELTVLVIDPLTAATAIERRTLVAAPPTDRLRLSDVLWASDIRPVRYASLVSYDEPFVLGPYLAVPRIASSFGAGETVKLFYEVYGGQPPYRVGYQLEGRELDGSWVHLGQPAVAAQEGATQAWELATAATWPAGDYRIRVTVQDRDDQSVEALVPFHLGDAAPAGDRTE
jgi:GWxTD domain-containing protein